MCDISIYYWRKTARGNAPGNINDWPWGLITSDCQWCYPGTTGGAPRPIARHPRIARASAGAVLLGMFAFLVMTATGGLEVEKRSVLLERVAARLRLRGPHFTDADLGVAIKAALTGLVQSAA